MRPDRVTLQWSVPRSVARRRKPQGKGGGPGWTAGNPAAPDWAGAESRLPKGRQALSDLTRVKSDKETKGIALVSP